MPSLPDMVNRSKDHADSCTPFQTDLCSPPKRKRAQDSVRVRTFSNDGKSGVSELDVSFNSDCLTSLSDEEQQFLPPEFDERASKCSIVQTGSGCEALMKQPTFFDAAVTGFLSGNGNKGRSFSADAGANSHKLSVGFAGATPSQSFVSSSSQVPWKTPGTNFAAATPALKTTSVFNNVGKTEYYMSMQETETAKSRSFNDGCIPFGTAGSFASDDTQSPVSTPFRFTSFPASLPRVNPKAVNKSSALALEELPSQLLIYDLSNPPPSPPVERCENRYELAPERMSAVKRPFRSAHQEEEEPRPSVRSTYVDGGTCSPVQARAVDVSHDSTISSISSSSPLQRQVEQPRQSAAYVATPLEMDPTEFHKVASGADWNDKIEQEEEAGKKVLGTRLNFNSLLSPEVTSKAFGGHELDNTLVIQNTPNELKRTFSNDTQEYDQDEAPEVREGATWMQIDMNWPRNHARYELDESVLTSRQYFESQLESAQFSPIRPRADSVGSSSSHCSSLQYAADESLSTQTPNFSSYHSKDTLRTKEEPMLTEKNACGSSFASSPNTSGKPRKVRPMPDMSAFDGYSSNTKMSDDKNSGSFLSTSSAICPPTPMVKPAMSRINSLQSHKVLADCNQSSLDNADILEDSGKLRLSLLNPAADLPVASSHDDDFDDEIGKANFGHGGKTVSDNPSESVVSFSDDFINLGILGSGAFADVFKVRCRTDNKLYAVKRRRRQFCSKRDRERALKEVRVMQKLQSCEKQGDVCPYLLKLVKAWQEDGFFFCQTELCCRDNCHHLIASMTVDWNASCKKYPCLLRYFPSFGTCSENSRGKLIPESSIWKICHDITAGLTHIHSCGIVHYDIKPCNIFFNYSASTGCTCKIGDFGIAGAVGSEEDGQEGDTAYMALEVLSSNVKDTSADIFSLGMTLYELSSDCHWTLPTEGNRWREIRCKSHDPELPASRSPALKELVKRMISPHFKTRPSASAILSGIDQVAVAGKSRDIFLEDFLKDVNHHEMMRERQWAAAQKAAFELRKTPTTSIPASQSSADRAEILRTPTPTSMEIFDIRTVRR